MAHPIGNVIEAVVESKVAVVPPVFISATTFLGVPWQQWMFITATIYSVLMIAGWIWKVIRKDK